MKTIVKKEGSKTIYKIVEDDYEEKLDWHQGDITTSCRRLLSMGDIEKDKWEKIFGRKTSEIQDS